MSAAPKTKQPSESSRSQLQINGWVCDFEVHETMWQVQSILRLAGNALEDETNREVAQQAVYGAERLLVDQLRRAGWEGMGSVWQEKGGSSEGDGGTDGSAEGSEQ